MSDILEFSTNIADAEAPPQLPAGTYPALCVASTAGQSKSGNPMLTLQFKINKANFPADFESDQDEVTLSTYPTTRDTTADKWRLKNLCQAMGVPMSNKLDPNDFVMKECRLETNLRPGLDGTPQANIVKVLSL